MPIKFNSETVMLTVDDDHDHLIINGVDSSPTFSVRLVRISVVQ